MKPLFLDTGFIIALEALDDQYHKTAVEYWRNLVKSLPQLVTTSYVFNEVVTFFNCRNQHAKAIEIGNRLLNSRAIRFIRVDKTLFHESWRYFEQHADKSYSLTDCLSFIVMERLGIGASLTFDKHFAQARFKTLP